MCEAEARRYAVGPANLLEDLHAPPRTHDADPGDACELCPNRRFPGSGNGQDHVRVADTVRQGCAGDTLKPLQQAPDVEVRQRPKRELHVSRGRVQAIDGKPGRVRTSVAQCAKHAGQQRTEARF